MRKINFGRVMVLTPHNDYVPVYVRNPQHWTEQAEAPERNLNMLPIIGGINGQTHYLITSGHWCDRMTGEPENRLECLFPIELNGQAILAHCTSHEAALAAFRLLQGAL